MKSRPKVIKIYKFAYYSLLFYYLCTMVTKQKLTMTTYIRRAILCLLLCVPRGGMTWAAMSSQAYHDWMHKPSAELLLMGNQFANSPDMQDSAMVCYTIIADRYTPQADRAEKELTVKALNEMGVLNATFYNDHTTAYQNLLQARDIGQQIGLEEMKPYVLLNLGNIYNIYEFLFPSAELSPQAGQYYEQSFRAACSLHNWDMAINSYINFVMLNMPYGVGEPSVHHEMASWLRDSIPTTTADWQLASNFLEGNLALIGGDAPKARHHYRQMTAQLPAGMDMARETYMVYTCIEASFLSEERYDSAIVYANKILQIETRQDLTDIHVETYRFLSEYYAKMGHDAEAAHYHTVYLENKDKLMKNIVGLVPTQLSHDLEVVSTEIGKMREQKRLQTIGFVVALVIIVLLIVFTFFISKKNRQLNEKNTILYRQMQEIIHSETPSAGTSKYRESQLKDDKKQMLVEKVREVMGDAQTICQPVFTLQSLAERVESNTSYLSQTINEQFGMTFTNLLNQYRVREACRRMEDQTNYGHLTIDAISESVGFKARVTFTKAFKMNVGMLPSEYVKAVRSDTSQVLKSSSTSDHR